MILWILPVALRAGFQDAGSVRPGGRCCIPVDRVCRAETQTLMVLSDKYVRITSGSLQTDMGDKKPPDFDHSPADLSG